jgi:periplasmic protein TonB
MTDSSVEKIFLYLVGLSLLLHCAAFALFYYLPEEKPPLKQEPYMVDLREMPEIKQPPPRQQEVKRLSDQRRRVPREMAHKGTRESDRPKPPTPKVEQAQSRPSRQTAPVPGRLESRTVKPAPQQNRTPQEPGDLPGTEQPQAQDFFKPDRKKTQTAKLFPSAGSMARMEESYRKRFEADVAEGNTNFLNTEDIQFGSFLRRFESAIYGVWRYPTEAARLGVEGIVPVRITFNRKGEVEHVELLESSRSRILDEEVLRTLHALGPIGGFPRNYTKDQFHLIAFFQYTISRGGMTGHLR